MEEEGSDPTSSSSPSPRLPLPLPLPSSPPLPAHLLHRHRLPPFKPHILHITPLYQQRPPPPSQPPIRRHNEHPPADQDASSAPSPTCGQMEASPSLSLQEPSSGATLSEDDSSSGDDGLLSMQGEGPVSPLKALSQIAHMKRKEDYMSRQPETVQGMDAADVEEDGDSDSVRERIASGKEKLKQVRFQLEPLVYEKLMGRIIEHHDGSFERFVLAALEAKVMQEKDEKCPTTIVRRPALSKWKRIRFDQLKGMETQELVQAFRSLAETTPGAEITVDLMNTPWQELSMSQIQKILEETKKMLLMNKKVFECRHPGCGRKFTTPGNLRDHLNEHSGDRPYSCSFADCPHRFTSKQLLCRHMKKHERAHRCTFEGCNKRFAFRERLIVHQKIHSDERPLACPWEGCGKTFKWANSLHGHMRTHTGEKPFQCTFPGCGRSFGYKVDLTRHRRTHFGQPARSSH